MHNSLDTLKLPNGRLGRSFRGLLQLAQATPRVTLACVMLAATMLVYLPFLKDMTVPGRFGDGSLYVVVAKTFYQITDEEAATLSHLPPRYFACHLPVFPAVIRGCSVLTLGNYMYAMFLATMLCAIASVLLFYQLLIEFELVRRPLWTAMIFCFFPARWLLYHSVGASEPLFLCLVFACFLAYRRGRVEWLALYICLASLTRITGALLGPIFCFLYVLERKWRMALSIPISGIGLVLLFVGYHYWFGDFFAYFTWNLAGERIVRWPPLALFHEYSNADMPRETEYLLAMYAIYGIGCLLLRRHRALFIYCVTFFAFTLFIHHNDVARYFLSLAAFSLLVGYDELLSRRTVRAGLLLLIPLYYWYAWGFIPINGMSSEQFALFLKFYGQ